MQGNFPYDSDYILNGVGTLLAYPVRVACEELADHQLRGVPLLNGLARGCSVFYNYSGSLECLDFKQVRPELIGAYIREYEQRDTQIAACCLLNSWRFASGRTTDHQCLTKHVDA